MNWIPGVSQLKSAIQLATGDVEGAAQTQADFIKNTFTTFFPDPPVKIDGDGIDSDKYSAIPEDKGLTEDQRKQKVAEHVKQSPSNEKVAQRKKVTFSNQKEIERMESDQDRDPKKSVEKQIEELREMLLFHLELPQELKYTSSIVLNHLGEGLLHTFVRHWNQWVRHIPELQAIIDQHLEKIKESLERIRNAETPAESRTEILILRETLDREIRDPDFFASLRKVLLKIYRLVQNLLKSSNFLGIGINGRAQVQLYFQVGNEVMVIAISKELYQPETKYDPRPIRTVSTIFFCTWDEVKDLLVIKYRDFKRN